MSFDVNLSDILFFISSRMYLHLWLCLLCLLSNCVVYYFFTLSLEPYGEQVTLPFMYSSCLKESHYEHQVVQMLLEGGSPLSHFAQPLT